jgi:pimeloyl-ACP methyl ester carboxylesterase
VATDYQGLGTPGPHPYLLLRPEAYSVLDSARAVLRGPFGLLNRVVIVGQSQGGGAAFATAGIAPDYAPEIDIRGAVATGVPYVTKAVMRPPAPSDIVTAPDHTFAYTLYLALVLEQINSPRRAEDLVTTHAHAALELARTTCVADMFKTVVKAELNRAVGLTNGFRDTFPTILPAMEYPTLKLKQPLFIGTGQEDKDVRPASQLHLAKDACAAGTTVEAHLYAGLNHSATVNGSLKDSLPFVRKVLAGETVTPVCEPGPQ